MIGRGGIEQQPGGEYAAFAAQSVKAIRDRLEQSAELLPGFKYSTFRVDAIQFADQAENGVTRFSIWYSMLSRMVYTFLPDGRVIKTGMIIDGNKKIVYSPVKDLNPENDSDFVEERRSPLPVAIEELASVTRVIQDPRANAGLTASLPLLPVRLN